MAAIKLNDCQFYYELHGKGHPLVLIAGYGCDHTFWEGMLADLSARFQVLLFDNRGIGQTTGPDEKLSLQMMAQDAITLIRALNLEKPHIVGQSMGGAIAQIVAKSYSTEINKLCILNSVAKFSTIAQLVIANSIKLQKENASFDTVIEQCLPWFYSSHFLSAQQNIDAVKSAIKNNPYLQPVIDQERYLQAISAFDSQTWLHEITAPTLVISSQEDIICRPEESEVLIKNIKAAQKATIPGGHSSPVEVPLEVNKALLSFLQASPSALIH